MRSNPVFVSAICDSNGNIISEFGPIQTEVITEKGYYRILSMLLNVVDSGTGNRLRRAPYNITAQMGGKTGTTNYNADGWFMGFTPDLVSGVWVISTWSMVLLSQRRWRRRSPRLVAAMARPLRL